MAVQDVLGLWEELDKLAHDYLNPIESEAQYQQALAFMEELWERVADNPSSPYGSLFRILSDNLHHYENRHQPIPEARPHQVLSYLMEEQNISQKDIEQATGIYQSNLSQILHGKRKLTTEHVKQLAAFFQVDPAVLL